MQINTDRASELEFDEHFDKHFDKYCDEHWMEVALQAARDAAQAEEVPVGACVVIDGCLVAVSGNRTRTDCDPTAHAEIIALREAAQKIKNFRLTEACIYVTLEPCAMCAGAFVQARIKRLVFGALDEKAGAVSSVFRICDSNELNHRIEWRGQVCEEESRNLLRNFFRVRRGGDAGCQMLDAGDEVTNI
ncbi:MAG: tRNA adenosine(34) deaminase TadA [Pyrinomonadaceae bacterium]